MFGGACIILPPAPQCRVVHLREAGHHVVRAQLQDEREASQAELNAAVARTAKLASEERNARLRAEEEAAAECSGRMSSACLTHLRRLTRVMALEADSHLKTRRGDQ